MRFGVFGVGAIGGIIGGYLARAGEDVMLIDTWPANIEKIKADGLTVTSIEEEFTVEALALHVGEVAMVRPQLDAVFLAVKSYDTQWAAKFIEGYLAPGGFIVSAQNSINDDAIAEMVGWSRVVGLVITLGGEMKEPGHVNRTSAADRHAMTVGEPNGLTTPRAQKIADALSVIGSSKVTANLWGERWAKLGNNCSSNAVSGFTGLSSGGLRLDPRSRALAIAIVGELLRVAGALGVSVEPIAGIPADLWAAAETDGAAREEAEQLMIDGAKAFGAGRPSLAQDVSKGRKTEVDLLNGYVVRRGKEVGVPTPVNQQVVEVTTRVEAGELEQALENLDLIQL